jgi:hypothetical protein
MVVGPVRVRITGVVMGVVVRLVMRVGGVGHRQVGSRPKYITGRRAANARQPRRARA